MGMEFYGDSYKGNDEPIFVGIPTFLKLPWVRNNEELKKIKPDIAVVGEPFRFWDDYPTWYQLWSKGYSCSFYSTFPTL